MLTSVLRRAPTPMKRLLQQEDMEMKLAITKNAEDIESVIVA
jgi:hypothetical protein